MPGPLEGGCLCKAVRYEIDDRDNLIYSVLCHCTNCRKTSGSQMVCASIFPAKSFSITSGKVREFADYETDSGKPLRRHFCEVCGSGLYATTPMLDTIVSIFSGSIDDSEKWWTPNKEQYVDCKNHFFPEFSVVSKEGIPERHPRGPLDLSK